MPRTPRTESRPRYSAVANDLRQQILSGDRPEGQPLPSYEQLAEHYGVSGMTVRNAIRQLVNEGVVVTRQGKGVFPRKPPRILRDAARRIAERSVLPNGPGEPLFDVVDTEYSFTTDSVRVQPATAPENVAAVLRTAETVSRHWRYLVNDVPVMVATSWIASSIASGTELARINPGEGGIYARLRDLGHEVVLFREEIQVSILGAAEAKDIGMDGPGPVLDIGRTAYTADGRAVEVTYLVADAKTYVLRYDLTP